jgi:2-isopropylmalate synthase
MSPDRVAIFDTTLRDGEQSPGCSMNAQEKLRMAQQLEQLGVDILEAGFPIASGGDFMAARMIANAVRRPAIAALARAKREDILCAWEAVKEAAHPRIHVFLATSDIHLTCKLKITREQGLRQIREAVALAASLCRDVEFSPEDATRSDRDFLCVALRAAVESGATTLNIPDTVGYATPDEYADLIRSIRGALPEPGIVISTHCHNDLGLAVANSLAGVQAGARQIECTINGIGERAGNAALEELVMAMKVRPDRLPYRHSIVTEQLYPTSRLLCEIIGVPVQPNKAVVGRNAFAHEAGIHQHGVISNPLCYEIMTPGSVGVPESRLVLGKHSGRHALTIRYNELGFSFTREQIEAIYCRFIELADRKKKIYDQDLLALVQKEFATSSTGFVSMNA